MKHALMLLGLVFARSAVADVTTSVAVEDFTTCAPVITASGVTDASSVAIEWSDSEYGT